MYEHCASCLAAMYIGDADAHVSHDVNASCAIGIHARQVKAPHSAVLVGQPRPNRHRLYMCELFPPNREAASVYDRMRVTAYSEEGMCTAVRASISGVSQSAASASNHSNPEDSTLFMSQLL